MVSDNTCLLQIDRQSLYREVPRGREKRSKKVWLRQVWCRGKLGWRSKLRGNYSWLACSCTSYEFLHRVPEATLCYEHNLQISNLRRIKFSSCGDESFKIAVVVQVVFSSTLTTPYLLNVLWQVVKLVVENITYE